MEWLILEVCYKKIISGLLEKSKLSTALYASVSVPGNYFSLQTKVNTRLNAQNLNKNYPNSDTHKKFEFDIQIKERIRYESEASLENQANWYQKE